MRAFLEHLESHVTAVDVEELAGKLAPGELEALRAAGFLQPTGSARWEEVSIPDVIRTLRALWGAGSGGIPTRATMGYAPMMLGCFELDDAPCDLVLVCGDAYSIAAAARRRERSLVLIPTDRALTREMRRRHGSRARVTFAVLSEVVGVHYGRICRIDLPVPMPSPLPLRGAASAPAPARSRTSSPPSGRIFDGVTAWEELAFLFLDHRTILVRFRQRERRLDARDLGLAYGGSGKPLKIFDMLLHVLAHDGWFKTWRFGKARANKQNLTRLRGVLCAHFGLEQNPFHTYRRGMGWEARFQVGNARAESEDALSPGARAVLARAGKLGNF